MPNTWRQIREMLHEQEDSIDLLVGKDDEFRELCSDFDDCVDALRRWSHSREPGAGAKADEYRALLEDLMAEVRRYLDLSPGHQTKSRGADG